MNDVLFEILKAALILVVVLAARYVIPWIKLQDRSGEESHCYPIFKRTTPAEEYFFI